MCQLKVIASIPTWKIHVESQLRKLKLSFKVMNKRNWECQSHLSDLTTKLHVINHPNKQAKANIPKANNRNTRKWCGTCLKLRIKTPEQQQWRCFLFFVLSFYCYLWRYFVLFYSVLIVYFEPVNVGWNKQKVLLDRSSHQRFSMEIVVLKNFTKFTEKHLCQNLFFNKVAGLGTFFTEHLRKTASDWRLMLTIKI